MEVDAIGITTGGPREITACVAGLIQSLERQQHAPRIIVADGTRDPVARSCRKRQLAVVANQTRTPIWYSGAEEREEFVHRLAGLGVDAAVAKFFVLARYDTPLTLASNRGASLNALLIEGLQQRLLIADGPIMLDPLAEANPPFLPTAGAPEPLWPQSLMTAREGETRVTFCSVIRLLLAASGGPCDPTCAGRRLMDAARQPAAEFERQVNAVRLRELWRRLNEIEHLSNALEEEVEEIRQQLTSAGQLWPAEIGQTATRASMLHALQSVVYRSGQLLAEWPALVGVCHTLIARGLGPAARLN